MTIDLENELLNEYRTRSGELLAQTEVDLMALELAGPAVDGDRAGRVWRAFHSVAAGAAVFALFDVRMVAHRAECLAASIRSGKIAPAPGFIHILLRSTDVLREGMQRPDVTPPELAVVARDLRGAMSPPTAKWASPEPGRMRTLLAEDDFASRLVLHTFLARFGECHVAVNGREAVDAFRLALQSGSPYHLICMDIMMPEMDGREAIRQVRQIEEHCGTLPPDGARIVMTTALDGLREVTWCFRELCDGYLVKPVDLSRLLGFMKSYDLVS